MSSQTEMVLTSVPPMPDGMIAVSEDEFFALLYADPRDIMPDSHSPPDHTDWRVVRSREVWGWTAPGWRNPGAHPKVYAVAKPR